MIIKFEGFDWDLGNLTKMSKRLNIREIEEIFKRELFVILDHKHSKSELRYIAIGENNFKKSVFICFTLRDRKIRIISARFMRAREVKKYEEFKKAFEDKQRSTK